MAQVKSFSPGNVLNLEISDAVETSINEGGSREVGDDEVSQDMFRDLQKVVEANLYL